MEVDSAPLERIRTCLEALRDALIRLDCGEVLRRWSELEALAPQLKDTGAGAEDCAELRSRLALARRLTQHATDLYAGWIRIAALEGSSYMPTGEAPGAGGWGSIVAQA